MGAAHKRGRSEIFGDILDAVQLEIKEHGSAWLTRVQARSNMSYDRLKEYVQMLAQGGLLKMVENEGTVELDLTQSGRTFLSNYRGMIDLLKTLGLF